jgi:hypothetical protein
MAIKTRQTTATGVTNNNAPLTNAELDNNFVELQQNKVDASGDTMTGDLNFGDNDKVVLGAGSDLQLYHDGQNSYISEVGTGDLYVRGSNFYITKPDGSLYFSGSNSTGEAGVYFNNSRKLATTTDGIDVTGEVKADKFTNDEALPDVRPSLLLDFANQKALDPRVDFRRGSIATYWDGETVTKAEENLVTSSEELSTSMSVVGATWTTDATTAPDGTTTADLLTESSGNESHRFYRINGTYFAGLLTGQRCTLSVYAKPNGKDIIQLNYYSGGGAGGGNTEHGQNFDITNGTLETSYGIVEGTSTIQDVGNGWYRCSMTFDVPISTTSSGTSPNVGVWLCESATDTTGRNHQGDGTSGVYFWGMQLERRGEVTTYTTAGSSAVVNYQPVLQTAGTDEARFDHDPVTGESKGLLIEEARTNLVGYSVVTSAADKNGISFESNAAVAPDGTVSAALITSDSTNDGHYAYYEDFARTSGAAITVSIFVKPLSMSRGYIWLGSGSSAIPNNIIVDTSDWTVVYSNGTASSVTEVGNGWYRISTTGTPTATGTAQIYVGFAINSTSPSLNYVGDPSDRMLIWGFQAETGSYPTSYIPTSGSTVTRSSDKASLTGTNFTEFYNPTEGTLFTDAITSQSSTSYMFYISDGTYTNRIGTYQNANGYARFLVRANSSTSADTLGTTAYSLGDSMRFAAAYAANDVAAVDNGSTAQTDNGVNVPFSIDEAYIGADATGSVSNSAHFKKIAYYPKRLPNATLQAMTEE